jgi:hypothetical protein
MKVYNLSPFLYLILISVPIFLNANVGGVAGSNIFTVADGNSTSTTWKIASASTLGDAVFSGVVSSRTTTAITFDTSVSDSNDTLYPFVAGAFNKDIQLPESNYTVGTNGDGNITSISNPTYGQDGFDSSGTGFTNPPYVIVSPSDGGGVTAELNATIDGDGKVTGFTIVNNGTGYTNSPTITVVGGPHFVRITDADSQYKGRCFLITSNTATQLTLDLSNISKSESDNSKDVEDFFPVNTQVEVVPAPTLGRIFGSYWPLNNWATATSFLNMGSEDWVYVWDPQNGGYVKYSFISGAGYDGWYARDLGFGVKCNNTIIYPDEAFIIAKRNAGTIQIESGISSDDTSAQIVLPQTDDSYLANNPYGMNLLLTELIPSTSIGSGATKFRTSADSDNITDSITILSGSTWKRFWYKSSVNDAVTSIMKAGARVGTGGSNAIQASDLLIASGTVTNLQSCTDASGSTTINGNDTNWTKITISGTAPATGFTVTLSDLQGYMLNGEGTHEVNATTGENIETNGTASSSVVYSNISGNFEVVGSGSGYFVVEKQRDVNFKSDEGSPAWSIGTSGAGYSGNAVWYAIGGNGSGANGTVTTGGAFTVAAGGSGYTSAPQIIISGGGWRYQDNSARDNETVNASDGIILYRGSSSGEKAFIESINPTN